MKSILGIAAVSHGAAVCARFARKLRLTQSLRAAGIVAERIRPQSWRDAPITRSMVVTAVFLTASRLLAQTPEPGTLTIVHRFAGTGPNGCAPNSLILNSDGNFYGTTRGCGANNKGTVFRMTPGGQLTVLHSFAGGTDGAVPVGPLTRDGAGNLYGITTGENTAFRVSRAGEFKSFGKLPYPPGTSPVVQPNGLFFASDGNLYGTSARGGKPLFSTTSDGVFFRVQPDGVMTVLHVFNTDTEGSFLSPVVEGSDGNLYATANFPSALLRITTAGVVTRLPDSSPPKAEVFGGLVPPPPLLRGLDGNFYGVARTAFKITSSGAFTSLAPTPGFERSPFGLVQGGDGNFYGASTAGVFQVTPGGVFTAIYRFNQADKTCSPGFCSWLPNALTQGPDGLYGTEEYDGGSIFKIVCPTCGGSSGDAGGRTPPVSQTTGPIEAVDPNNDELRPLLAGALGWNPAAYNAFAISGHTVSGIAADGVTQVALRWAVPKAGTASFSITDESDVTAVQVGSLGCIDSAACAPAGAASYEVPAQVLLDGKSYMAFALLRAPADFTRRGSGDDESQPRRPLHITATFASADGVKAKQTAELSLARPPVVLLHGIWSDLATWKWPLQQDSNFLVLAWSYKDTNSARFAVNLEQPRLAIRAALDALRFKGVAVTQADFVGHSMGGILARLYAGEFNGLKYYRDDNLHAGDIHKLITLDTPHAGSELADQLVDDNGAATLKGEAAAAGLQECMICGAVSDLRTLSSILRNMPAAPPPAHAIVGVGGGAVLDDLGGFAAAAKDVGGPTARLALAAGAGADWIVGTVFGGRNDLIVSETSQRGGLPDDAVTVFEYQLPFGMALHTTVTSEGRISDEVVKLLNQPVGSPAFSHFEKTGR